MRIGSDGRCRQICVDDDRFVVVPSSRVTVRLGVVVGREFGWPFLPFIFLSSEYANRPGGEKKSTTRGKVSIYSRRSVNNSQKDGLEVPNTHSRPFELAIFGEVGREKS